MFCYGIEDDSAQHFFCILSEGDHRLEESFEFSEPEGGGGRDLVKSFRFGGGRSARRKLETISRTFSVVRSGAENNRKWERNVGSLLLVRRPNAKSERFDQIPSAGARRFAQLERLFDPPDLDRYRWLRRSHLH